MLRFDACRAASFHLRREGIRCRCYEPPLLFPGAFAAHAATMLWAGDAGASRGRPRGYFYYSYSVWDILTFGSEVRSACLAIWEADVGAVDHLLAFESVNGNEVECARWYPSSSTELCPHYLGYRCIALHMCHLSTYPQNIYHDTHTALTNLTRRLHFSRIPAHTTPLLPFFRWAPCLSACFVCSAIAAPPHLFPRPKRTLLDT